MEVLVNNDILRLRKMKGISRVWKPNPISEIILGIEFEDYPGIWHEFLESRPYSTECGEWIEHKWLLRGLKEIDLGTLMKTLGKCLGGVEMHGVWKKEVDYYSLEDIDSTEPSHYYFLISILSNGENYPEKENVI